MTGYNAPSNTYGIREFEQIQRELANNPDRKNLYDLDNNNTIDDWEWKAISQLQSTLGGLASTGYVASLNLLDEVADLNKDDKVTKEEFDLSFKFIDTNNNNILSLWELQNANIPSNISVPNGTTSDVPSNTYDIKGFEQIQNEVATNQTTRALFDLNNNNTIDDWEWKAISHLQPSIVNAAVSFDYTPALRSLDKVADLNKDGKVTKEEFYLSFNIIDSNNDGILTKQELSRKNLTSEITNSFDLNNNGTLNKNELTIATVFANQDS
jgi:Ca2+-binding EF-hand superfamily protein